MKRGEGQGEEGSKEEGRERGGREEGSGVIFFRVCFHCHLFQVALKLLVSHWEGVEEVVQRHSRPNLYSTHNELILSYTGNILGIYWEYTKNILGIYWEYTENILRIY